MMTRDRSFRAAAPTFIRRESGLLVPDRSLEVRAARRFGYKVRNVVLDPFEQHAAVNSGNSVANSNSVVTTSGITTTLGNCIILAFISAAAISTTPSVTSVTGGGLTWHQWATNSWNGTGSVNSGRQEIWWAKATSALTNQTVTANFANSTNGGAFISVVAISGANVTAGDPFDVNASATKVASNATASLTALSIAGVVTTAADTIQYVQETLMPTGSALIGPGSPTGFTTVTQQVASPSIIQTVGRRVNTAAQNNTITNASTRAFWGMSTTAVRKA